jgi:hypothetical protein
LAAQPTNFPLLLARISATTAFSTAGFVPAAGEAVGEGGYGDCDDAQGQVTLWIQNLKL